MRVGSFISLLSLLAWVFVVGARAQAAGVEASYGNSILKNGDLLKISVYGEPDLMIEARVSASGALMFPLVGEVPLSGLTVTEAAALLEQRLADGYLVEPKVSLNVIESAKLLVSVIGAVRNPGDVAIPEGGTMDVMRAVAMAGGFAEGANRNEVQIRRKGPQGEESLAIRLDRPMEGNGLVLQPGDTLTVFIGSSQERVTMIGQVAKPGTLQLAPEQLPIDLLSAVALAGGFTPASDLKQISVKRKVDGEDAILVVDASQMAVDASAKPFFLEAGDVVTIREKPKEMIIVLGQVAKPGSIEIPPNTELDVLSAIAMAGGFTRIADPGKVSLRRQEGSETKVYRIDAKRLAKDAGTERVVLKSGDVLTVAESLF